MEGDPEKRSLRGLLLERRDGTSSDLMKIASGRMQKRLGGIEEFKMARKVGAYYPIGSEIPTQDIIQELFSRGREVFLPKVVGDGMEFRKISGFASLERGSFEIMEPRDGCPADNDLDVILVPAVGMTRAGMRLGYGHGYYDRFLAQSKATTISLILEKQIVRNIPRSEHDVLIDWIVTEDQALRTQ